MDDGLGTALPTTIEDRARREQTDNCWDAAEVAQMTVLGRNAAKLLAATWRTLAALRPKKCRWDGADRSVSGHSRQSHESGRRAPRLSMVEGVQATLSGAHGPSL